MKKFIIISAVVVIIIIVIAIYIKKKNGNKSIEQEAEGKTTPSNNPEKNANGIQKKPPVTTPAKFPLKKGSKGIEVVRLQAYLNKMLNYKIPPDGIFGSLTEQAMENAFKSKVMDKTLYQKTVGSEEGGRLISDILKTVGL